MSSGLSIWSEVREKTHLHDVTCSIRLAFASMSVYVLFLFISLWRNVTSSHAFIRLIRQEKNRRSYRIDEPYKRYSGSSFRTMACSFSLLQPAQITEDRSPVNLVLARSKSVFDRGH